MIKIILTTLAALNSATLFASGFTCRAKNHPLGVAIYNHVHPGLGTNRAAVMVLSDLSVKSQRKTIAVFKDANKTLQGGHNYYAAKVDLRSSELKKGEYLLDTRLGHLSYIFVRLDFSQRRPVGHGHYLAAKLMATTRRGGHVTAALDCWRYLKLQKQ